MLGEFMYHNPTTLYFGSQSLENLDRELPLYGPNVLWSMAAVPSRKMASMMPFSPT